MAVQGQIMHTINILYWKKLHHKLPYYINTELHTCANIYL